jgi:diguanylate cyclase (GGDEF)-like protein
MITERIRRWIAPVSAALAVGLLVNLSARANQALLLQKDRQALQHDLHLIAVRIQTQVNLLSSSAPDITAAKIALEELEWNFDGHSVRSTADDPDTALHKHLTAAVARLAQSRTREQRFLAVVPSADGTDFVVAFQRNTNPARGWHAAGISLEAILGHSGVVEMLQTGCDLQIYEARTNRLLYQSRPLTDTDPVATAVEFDSGSWELWAQPGPGISGSNVSRWLLVLLLGGAAGYWTAFQVNRPAQLRVQVRELTHRMSYLNSELAQALRVREQVENRTLALIQTDGASGLPNRKSLAEAIERELSAIRTTIGAPLSVIVIRFDSLTEIASAYGHDSVDRVLREASTRIQALVGIQGTLGRISEFELALWKRSAESREALHQYFSAELSRPYKIGAFDSYVSFSIGLAVVADGFAYGDEAIQHASTAALRASAAGSGSVLTYEPKSRESSVNRLEMEADLRRSLSGEGLELHFQPIVRADTSTVAGFEALLRWRHPLEGLLLPGRFLPIVESSQLQLELDSWVMRATLLQARQWQTELDSDFFISFNLCPQNFARPALAREVADALEEYGVDPKHLRVEIVESALVSDVAIAARVAAELRELGVRICLDDFGTGYSSLNYLRTLPIDCIKVDRSFVERMVTNSKDFGVVKAIIDLAHYLELSCVAEGVETAEQRELLEVLGCEMYQGYFFSAAVPAERAAALVRNSPVEMQSA